MTKKETTSEGALWRKRALATLGAAAVVASGGVALASSAFAATSPTAPTITVTASKSIANDGTGIGNFSIEINNSAAGNQKIGVGAGPAGSDYSITASTLTLTFTLPAGQLCANFGVANSGPNVPAGTPAPVFTTGPAAGATGTCTYTAPNYTQSQNSDYTFKYIFADNAVGSATPTGTITTVASLAETVTNTNGNTTSLTASGSATTTLAAPAAPTLSTATPPSGIIYQDYNAQVVSTTGTPTTGPNQYSVFETPVAKSADGTYENGHLLTVANTGNQTVFNPATKEPDAAIELEDNLFLDTITGTIVGNPSDTDSNPEFSYTVIANNQEGGASATQVTPAQNGGTTAKPTPGVALHDVQSAPFTIPVLFSDVTTTSTFGPAIYDLSDNGAINGFADGTFRPGATVTREQYVAILFRDDPAGVFGGLTGSGECTTVEPSAFSDVPNSSIFCEAIKKLSQAGIVNGTGGGKFSPNAPVLRSQIAAFEYRFYAVERTHNPTNGDAQFTSPSPFKDVTASTPLGGDIEWAAKNHVVNGYTDGTFRPAGVTTRDAAAAVIDRTNNLF